MLNRARCLGLVLFFVTPALAQDINPEALPVPPRRAHFDVPATDISGLAARRIDRRIPTFRNFRAEVPLATWVHDDQALWAIRGTEECYAALRAAEVPFEVIAQPTELVPSPVRITQPVHGVTYTMIANRKMDISCEMALRLPELSRILLEHGLVRVRVMSAHRFIPRTSFHTMGLALDLSAFFDAEGRSYRVLTHYQATPGQKTCEGPEPTDAKAAKLKSLACALHHSTLFSSVLTPNYNDGHRDHFHIDIRPDDPRLFLR